MRASASNRYSLLFAALVFTVLAGCGGDSGDAQQPPPAAVSVAEVLAREVTEWDEFSGRIEAVDTVQLRPRVTGYLRGVHFDEGAIVEKDALLFSIDDREFQASLALAVANVVRAETRVELAEQQAKRGEQLQKARALSAEELDQRNGELRQARADLNSAQAERERARLDLSFTKVRAPIAGRIGEAMVKPGNLVSPTDTVLSTLVSIDPIHVVFEGDERIYLKYQAQAMSGERPSSRDAPNPVQVGLASDNTFPYHGHMNFVDNRINPATGTIQGRAELPNPDGFLIPGLFARVRLLGSGSHEAILIDDIAVLTDQDRKYVYVVGNDNLAVRRDVVLGRDIDGLRVVEQGLSAGERIVVNGVRKIFFSGAPVLPTIVPMETPMLDAETAGG